MPALEVHAHSIVSEDDFLTDETGEQPEALKLPADQAYFQKEMETMRLVIIGSKSHELYPNGPGRRRLVLTSKVQGLESDEKSAGEVYFINPTKVPLASALAKLVPEGGKISVAGGPHVIEACWELPIYVYHLSRAKGIYLRRGLKVFLDCEKGTDAETVLTRRGFVKDKCRMLDDAGKVELCDYRLSQK